MTTEVYNTIVKYNMLPKGSKVLVALSGGSDSMSLLYSLIALKDKLSLTIEAAHVNHCLRGEMADSDEAFVRKVCNELGIKLYVLKVNVALEAENNGLSTEECGRRIRYNFFNNVCSDGYIATAHNLNDRIETFLFNFTRGTSLKGLCSIPPVRGRIIRPLINCSKSEILNYCSINKIDFVTDITNFDVKYSRNRIRNNIIPQLKEINPSFENSAIRCIEALREDEVYLNSLAYDAYIQSRCDGGYNLKFLNELPIPIKKRTIAFIINFETEAEVNSYLINEIIGALDNYTVNGKGSKVQINETHFARARAGILEFLITSENDNIKQAMSLNIGINEYNGFLIDVSLLKKNNDSLQFVYKNLAEFQGDYDSIIGKLNVRVRQPGDSIKLKSRRITKTLRKIQNENKILPEIRDISPVIVDDEGVLCAYGCGIDERFIVSANTERVIIIKIMRKE